MWLDPTKHALSVPAGLLQKLICICMHVLLGKGEVGSMQARIMDLAAWAIKTVWHP